MKSKLILLLGFILFVSQVKAQDKYFTPDTSVNEICLYDSTTLLKVIPDVSKYINHAGPGAKAIFLNNNSTEKITLIFHAGGNRNEVAEFKIELTETKNFLLPIIDTIKSFKTNSGIMLGIDQQTLIKNIGNDFEIKKDNEKESLIYKINDFETSEFLCEYNMPEYYAEYEFKNQKLIMFKFGFEYP